MSLKSLTDLAVERDAGEPKKRPTPKRRAASPPVTEEKTTYTRALISAIPTEVLALYTFLVTEVVGTIAAHEDKRLTMRWILYAAGIAAVVVYLVVGYVRRRHTRKRRFPGTEIFAAAVAFGAWGLVMPGSPLVSMLSSDNARIWSAIITVAGVFLLALAGGSLTSAAGRAR